MANIVAMSAAPANALATAADIHRAIVRNITALEIAFPAGRSGDQDERDMRAAIVVEAIAETDPAIALYVLKTLRLHNSRNPFPPTPQDVFKHCRTTTVVLRSAALNVATKGGGWPPSADKLPATWFANIGPAPFEPGCILSDATIKGLIAECLPRDLLGREYWRITVNSRRDKLDILRRLLKIPTALEPDLRAECQAAVHEIERRERDDHEQQEADDKRRLKKFGRQVFSAAEFDRFEDISEGGR